MTEAMRELGFEAHGVEPHPPAVAYAREHYPKNSYHQTFMEAFEPAGLTFGAVYCSEVIEHSPDINGFIDAVKDNLDVVRLMVNENLSGGHVMGAQIKEAMMSMESMKPQRFVEKLTAAIASGEVRPVDPKQTLLSVISCCHYFLITLPTVCIMNPEATQDLDAYIEQRKAHIFDLVYCGLKPRADETA